jgi:cytochrome c peroxidase
MPDNRIVIKRKITCALLVLSLAIIMVAFNGNPGAYKGHYSQQLAAFASQEQSLLQLIQRSDMHNEKDIEAIRRELQLTRNSLKGMDFWLRYLEPTTYKKLNGPLPVEWETEVFEKFEKPYRREGAGLTLAQLYLDEPEIIKDTLLSLIRQSVNVLPVYSADSIASNLNTYHHFFLCNRLFLLNLAAIYTTGFECPDTSAIIPELRLMLAETGKTYTAFNESFPATPLTEGYLNLYNKALAFVQAQPANYTSFDHFTFIKDYVNPLYTLNQQLITEYKVITRSLVDYSINKVATSIFSKNIYNGQNPKGIFLRVRDTAALAAIESLGKLLFYDPILSGNNQRSCASCHKPEQFFTDTSTATSLAFNGTEFLPRNSPSLINAEFNHLIMMDGKHYSLQHQTQEVVSNPAEMASRPEELLKKILSCKDYSRRFKALLPYTPQEKEITFEHLSSALTFYYSKFSRYAAPFDEAINENKYLSASARDGFNLFMGKAQCATCHFVPQFNGVKPPFVGSEFEVLGVPGDTAYKALSKDKGRYEVNAAGETLNAFRTGSLRNAARTAPYMHNGVFRTLEQVVDFYNDGGGAGHGLNVPNQTLSSDSLKLNRVEKSNLIAFIKSLNEHVVPDAPPANLPLSRSKALNKRRPGGNY